MKPTLSMKDAAVAFLKLACAGKIQEAYAHTAEDFRHHNVYFRGDKQSLMKGMDDNAREFPDKTIDIKHVLEDGDLVAVHGHVKMKAGHPGYALVHIFRFEQGGIAELWDMGQEVPEDSPNENGMF
jgi:predicted SnoaL-like aldol condensation-catalyzing enzyme